MKKSNVLIIGTTGSLILFYVAYISINGLCIYKYLCSRLHDDSMMAVFLPFIPLFLLSLVTYKMRDETFHVWLKFTYVWVPLTIILTFLSPEYGNSLLPIEKSSVSFTMSLLFLFISLIIIISKSLSLRKK